MKPAALLPESSSPARILVGGDLCPVNRFEPMFVRGEAEAILGPAAPWARGADLFLANLECPLIRSRTPIAKTGPVLGADAGAAKGLKALGLHALGLANNHIMDHGPSGLASTLEACAQAGIATFGAGSCLEEAGRPFSATVKGVRVGALAMAEREWSIAGPHRPGACPLDPIDFVGRLRDLRARVDFLAVLVHGGSEGFPFPSPRLRRVCRFLVDEGADLVTCQHSHCAGSFEAYRERLILYGQGNFIFDYPSHPHKEGLLIALDLHPGREPAFTLVPFAQGAASAGLVDLEPGPRAAFLAALEERSASLDREGFLEAQWEDYCRRRTLVLMDDVLGHGRILRRLNAHGALLRMRGEPYFRNLLSIIQNESALETLDTLLRSHLP